jgi:transposase
MIRIIGLDVCKASVAACLLTDIPEQPKDWFRKNRKVISYLKADREGLQSLLDYNADIAVLEPTGVHYSTLWAKKLTEAGTIVLWIGHANLKYHRQELRLPNKNDQADALAMACYGHKYINQPERFLNLDLDSPGAIIRQHSLQLRHLDRVASPVINRIRQQLAHEWPEKAQSKSLQSEDNAAPLWRYIAGLAVAKGTKTKYDKELAASVGFGLSDFTVQHTRRLVGIQEQQCLIEKEMCKLLGAPRFEKYNVVFDRFRMPKKIRAMLLSHCYPIEQFLLADFKEHIEYVESCNRRRSRRRRSLSAFKLALGCGLVESSSGDESRWVAGGSKLCRIALWQWITVIIQVKGGVNKNGSFKKSPRPDNHIGERLGLKYDKGKESGIPYLLLMSKIANAAVEMLFEELLAEMRKPE